MNDRSESNSSIIRLDTKPIAEPHIANGIRDESLCADDFQY